VSSNVLVRGTERLEQSARGAAFADPGDVEFAEHDAVTKAGMLRAAGRRIAAAELDVAARRAG
jgi:hypothetical protein